MISSTWRADGLERDAEALERLGGDAVALVDQAEQDVLGADVVVGEHAGLFLGQHDHPTGPVGEPLEHASPSGCVWTSSPVPIWKAPRTGCPQMNKPCGAPAVFRRSLPASTSWQGNAAVRPKRDETVRIPPRQREEDRLADADALQQHDQAVDAQSHATGRRHAELQRAQEVLVDVHRLGVAGRGQARPAPRVARAG